MLEEIIAWLAVPWSGATDHVIAPVVSWHGRIMVAAWGLAIPVSVLLARYFKVTYRQRWPQELDNKFWWHAHRALNYTAVVATCAATLLLWRSGEYGGSLRDLHGWMGWTIVAMGLLQVLGGHLRGTKGGPTDPRRAADGTVLDLRGDHFDMTPRRILFERIHKSLGYGLLLLSAGTIVLGLAVADAPRWMWLGLALWWVALFGYAARLQAAGRCIDTYQAIWGPDSSLPGSSVAPIGFGIRKAPSVSKDTTRQAASNSVLTHEQR